MSFAGKNLKYLRKQKGWTQDEFANRVQIKRSLVGAYEEDRAEPKLEVLQALCEIFNLTLEELLFQDLNEPKQKNYLDQRRKLKAGSSNNVIHFVPIKAVAGYMSGYADPDFIDELNTFTLPMLAPGQYRAFEIVGDSMLPTPSGSVIVGEKVESLNELKNSYSYVLLSRNDGVVYKRILKNGKTKNKLTLVSDNPVYEPYIVSEEDVLEVWKAVYILNKANATQRWDVNQLVGVVNTLQQEVVDIKKKFN